MLLADGEDLEAVALGLEASFAAEAVAEGDQFGDIDGNCLSRVDADEQVVGAAAVHELVVGLVLVE